MGKNRTQQIVEIVRDARGEHAQTLQFLMRDGPLLFAFQFGNVERYPDVAGKFTVQEKRNACRQRRSVFSVRLSEAEFNLVSAVIPDGGVNRPNCALGVCGMNCAPPAVVRDFFSGQPGESQTSLAHISEDARPGWSSRAPRGRCPLWCGSDARFPAVPLRYACASSVRLATDC